MLKSKDGHAIMVVEVPAHKQEVSVAYSSIDGCAVAAVEAWDRVKGEGDAAFIDATPPFRQQLVNAAESVYKTGKVMDGDLPMARFEQEVARIKERQEKEKVVTMDQKKAARA